MSSQPRLLEGKLLFPFIAPPNGGKGTQTRILSEKYGLPTFDMGTTFRGILKEGRDPQLKAELESYMGNGKLVPVETVVKVFKKNFEALAAAHPDVKGFILDGFPRNREQAAAMELLSQEWGTQPGKVIYLEVSLDVVRARAIGRRFCSLDPRHVYNVNNPSLLPKHKHLHSDGTVEVDVQGREVWLCDEDGAPLVVRPDDEPQTVEKRLTEYRQETDPLVDYFRTHHLLVEVDGEQPPEKVAESINAIVQPLMAPLPAM